VEGLETNTERVDVQLAALEPLAALLMYDTVYDRNLICRLIRVAFDVMHTQLLQLMPCVVGITKSWTLDIVPSTEVAIVYGVLDLLCHLAARENPMGSGSTLFVTRQAMGVVSIFPLVWKMMLYSGKCSSSGKAERGRGT